VIPKNKIQPVDFHRIGVISIAAALFLFMSSIFPAASQAPIRPPDESPYHTEPSEPFHIIDNIYAVGETLHLINYLITTDEGHILIDTGYVESVPAVQANIEKLGFRVEDIRFLIASHAHTDHVAGFARMQELSGAAIVAGRRDVDNMETGGVTDFRGRVEPLWPPVTVDQPIDDGDEIRLGDTILTAHSTPGHTKGCTTWTMSAEEDGQQYDVIFFCGTNIADSALPVIGNPGYPEMADDYAASFAKLKSIPVDVYLGGHGYWFWIEDKLARMRQGDSANPFVDPEGYRRAIEGLEQRYLDRLADER
jgi:metallo-beta-lactamase class B